MLSSTVTRALAGAALAYAIGPAGSALAQSGPPDCTVHKGAGGLIRGDQIPSGCVLINEDHAPGTRRSSRSSRVGAGVPIFFTPHPAFIVLAGHAPLAVGRGDVTAPPASSATAGSRPRRFGPLQRHFGPLQRHFGPLQRHFGPLQRHFGPPARHRAPAPLARPARRSRARSGGSPRR